MASGAGAAAGTLVGWLLTYLLHSTVLLAVAWLLSRSLSHRRPAVIDVIWKVAMVGGLLTATLQAAAGVEPLLGYVELRIGSMSVGVPGTGGVADGTAGVGEPQGTPIMPLQLAPGVALSITGVWSILALVSLGRLVLRVRRVRRRLGRRPLDADDGCAVLALDELAEMAGLRRGPRLTVSSRLASPAAFGLEICLPAALPRELSPDGLRGVLAHEVAHLRRRDPLWAAIAGALVALFPFQPLNRTARRELRSTAELLCDDWARAVTGAPLALARALLEVAERVSGSVEPAVVSALASGASGIARRIQRLLEEPTPDVSVSVGRRLAMSAALVLGSMAVLAPGFATGAPRASVEEPLRSSMRIDAVDPAGEFTLTLEEGRVVSATIEGVRVPDHLLVQTNDSLRFVASNGRPVFSVRVRDNGISWEARPADWRAPELD